LIVRAEERAEAAVQERGQRGKAGRCEVDVVDREVPDVAVRPSVKIDDVCERRSDTRLELDDAVRDVARATA
jgi:hypothetical protein